MKSFFCIQTSKDVRLDVVDQQHRVLDFRHRHHHIPYQSRPMFSLTESIRQPIKHGYLMSINLPPLPALCTCTTLKKPKSRQSIKDMERESLDAISSLECVFRCKKPTVETKNSSSFVLEESKTIWKKVRILNHSTGSAQTDLFFRLHTQSNRLGLLFEQIVNKTSRCQISLLTRRMGKVGWGEEKSRPRDAQTTAWLIKLSNWQTKELKNN